MNSERAEQSQSLGKLEAPGAQLAAAREALGLTVMQIADQLKLAPRQVVALEAGDLAALPNLAVVRGFVRAYAKAVKLDAAPLVAMIAAPVELSAVPRRQVSASFSEARFPIMGKRSTRPTRWIVAGLLLLVVAAVVVYQMGWTPAGLLNRAGKDGAARLGTGLTLDKSVAPAAAGQLETTLIKPGQELAPVQSTSVPLISVPPLGNPGIPVPVAAPTAPAAAGTAPTALTAPVASNALVLSATGDSWVEIRRAGAAPLLSRVLKAGSTETVDITQPVTLIVGKPAGVSATLRGAPLALTPGRRGAAARLKLE